MPFAKKRKIVVDTPSEEVVSLEEAATTTSAASLPEVVPSEDFSPNAEDKAAPESNSAAAVTQNLERQERFKALQARAVRLVEDW